MSDDLKTGERFGRWTVIEPDEAKSLCRCDCGTERSVDSYNLRRGASTSCGHCRVSESLRARASGVKAGDRFGHWTVLNEADPQPGRKRRFACRCACGTERTVRLDKLRSGESGSCGCVWQGPVRHGHAKAGQVSPTYQRWTRLIHRANHGGVAVCERWSDFAEFLADMGEQRDGTRLHLIDADGIYEPGNATWEPVG